MNNRNPDLASQRPSARGRRFSQPIAYNFTRLSIRNFRWNGGTLSPSCITSRVVNEWAVFGHSNMPHSSTCSFEYSNTFEYVVQHDLIFKMSHIEAKSVNRWLRNQLKQVHIYGGCFRATWTCFSWYLSHLLTDFASIWLIWMSSILSFEWTNIRWEKRSFEYSNIRIIHWLL